MVTIKTKKRFSRVSRLLSEYRESLKPPETEEIINQFLNRPLAFFTAKAFQSIRRSPNFITVWSMLFGVSSGFFFVKGDYSHFIIGAILLELMIIFDCADGQLARLTHTSSRLGKTLDGLADFSTHMSIFYGVALGLYLKTGRYYPFIEAILAQLTMYLHIILYDHFKNVFINVTKPEYEDRVEPPDEMKLRIEKEIAQYGRKGVKAFISKLYYYFYKIEYMVVAIGYLPIANNFYDLFPEPSRMDSYLRELYYREMRLTVKLWSFIGDTTHLTLFILFALINRIDLLFPMIIVFTNIYMLIVLFFQRIKFKSLRLERETLWYTLYE